MSSYTMVHTVIPANSAAHAKRIAREIDRDSLRCENYSRIVTIGSREQVSGPVGRYGIRTVRVVSFVRVETDTARDMVRARRVAFATK